MELSNNDYKKFNSVKESLEDMALYLSEIERLSIDIIGAELKGDEDTVSYLRYKLKILEMHLENIQNVLKDQMSQNSINKKQLS